MKRPKINEKETGVGPLKKSFYEKGFRHQPPTYKGR